MSVLIPTKLKKKIWKNKFVDLGRVIPKNGLQQNQQFTFELGVNSDVSFVPKKPTRKIDTTELRTTAFLRFMAVYTDRYPLRRLILYGIVKLFVIWRIVYQAEHGLCKTNNLD